MFTVLRVRRCWCRAKSLLPSCILQNAGQQCTVVFCRQTTMRVLHAHYVMHGAHMRMHLHDVGILSSVKSWKCLNTTVGTTPTSAAAAAAAVYLEGLIGLAAVGGTCMVDDFALQGPGHRVPQVRLPHVHCLYSSPVCSHNCYVAYSTSQTENHLSICIV